VSKGNIDFSANVAAALKTYGDDVVAAVMESSDSAAAYAVSELKNRSPKRKGRYAKSWAKKVTTQNARVKVNTVYNAKYYQLTHLLENDHKARDGGITRGKPHIGDVETLAINKFVSGLEDRLG
jgi:hypothetical protein